MAGPDGRMYTAPRRAALFEKFSFSECCSFIQRVRTIARADGGDVAKSVSDALAHMYCQMVRIFRELEHTIGGPEVCAQFFHLSLHYMILYREVFFQPPGEGYDDGDGGLAESMFLIEARERADTGFTSSAGAAGSAPAAAPLSPGFRMVCFRCGSERHLAPYHTGDSGAVPDAAQQRVRSTVRGWRLGNAVEQQWMERAAAFWAKAAEP